jgi:hypothetical protein
MNWHYEGGRVWHEGDNPEPIAYVEDAQHGPLIAAAPAMLAALKRIHVMAAEYGNNLRLPDDVAAMFYDIVEDAGDAIAAAKGADA